jgi:hypothetical protein
MYMQQYPSEVVTIKYWVSYECMLNI